MGGQNSQCEKGQALMQVIGGSKRNGRRRMLSRKHRWFSGGCRKCWQSISEVGSHLRRLLCEWGHGGRRGVSGGEEDENADVKRMSGDGLAECRTAIRKGNEAVVGGIHFGEKAASSTATLRAGFAWAWHDVTARQNWSLREVYYWCSIYLYRVAKYQKTHRVEFR